MSEINLKHKQSIIFDNHPINVYQQSMLSCPKTHSKGMTVISHLKSKDTKWKRHKHSYCNWKFTNYQIPIQSSMTKF